MSIDRMKRVDEMIRREIGQVLYRLIGDEELDLSAVTATRVETARNLRSARVYVSIRDHQGEQEQMLSHLKRHRIEIQAHLNHVLNLKYTPKLVFLLDSSIAQGDHVLDVLHNMEAELSPEPPLMGDSDRVAAEEDPDA